MNGIEFLYYVKEKESVIITKDGMVMLVPDHVADSLEGFVKSLASYYSLGNVQRLQARELGEKDNFEDICKDLIKDLDLDTLLELSDIDIFTVYNKDYPNYRGVTSCGRFIICDKDKLILEGDRNRDPRHILARPTIVTLQEGSEVDIDNPLDLDL